MISILIKKMAVVVVLVFGAGVALANAPGEREREGIRAVTLSWTAPSQRTDGSLVRNGDIVGYRVYIGESSGEHRETVHIDNPQVTGYTVRGLQQGEYRFAVTALDIFGNESPMSEELLFSVQ